MSTGTFFYQLDCDLVQDTTPVFDKAALERLLQSADRFSKVHDNAGCFFDTVLEIAVYLCLFPMEKRDILFMYKLRCSEEKDHWYAAHNAKSFVLSEWTPLAHSKGSVLDDLDAVLGSLIAAFTYQYYSYYENMIANPVLLAAKVMGFPDCKLLRQARLTAQSVFTHWDDRGEAIYADNVFALLVCLYAKYRSRLGRKRAVNWLYRLTYELFGVRDPKFLDMAYKAVALVEGVYSRPAAKMYRPAVVLWHIFRVLRRLSEGFACDEWMKCGCEPECESCDCRFAPDHPGKSPEGMSSDKIDGRIE